MSDDNKTLERLKAELDVWRGRLDHLRVQADLGRMEARDKLRELEQRMDPVLREADQLLGDVLSRATGEARTLGRSLLAGWDELRRTHRDLTREASLERSKPRRQSER